MEELATELGCPAALMGDSAKMNIWLHKTVLNKIAENGGQHSEGTAGLTDVCRHASAARRMRLRRRT